MTAEMMDVLFLVLQFASFLMGMLAVYYSYGIYRCNRLNKGWLFITIGISLLTIRRLLGFAMLANYWDELPLIIEVLDRPLIPFFTMTFLLMGLHSMWRSFKTFDVVERGIVAKMGNLHKSGKRRIK